MNVDEKFGFNCTGYEFLLYRHIALSSRGSTWSQ